MRILPRRGQTGQPRASPWDQHVKPTPSPERAAHGHRDVAPIQGSGILVGPDARAMPWADLWLPLRGDRQRYRYRCHSVKTSRISGARPFESTHRCRVWFPLCGCERCEISAVAVVPRWPSAFFYRPPARNLIAADLMRQKNSSRLAGIGDDQLTWRISPV
jgi:hypothetical protein